jgi:two-component system response regulator MprA
VRSYLQPAKWVLCVDDHDDTCIMLTHLLGFEGYRIQFVATAAAALELADPERFDLYLLDNRLPDKSGIELCRLLRMRCPATPIVMYSGDAYSTQHSAAMEAGATAYVDKPNVEQLIATVRDFLTD